MFSGSAGSKGFCFSPEPAKGKMIKSAPKLGSKDDVVGVVFGKKNYKLGSTKDATDVVFGSRMYGKGSNILTKKWGR